MDSLLILKFLIALALGALIGIERERKQEGAEFAGIRTFILISIMGTISAYLSQFFPYFWIVAFAGLVVLVGMSYLVTTRKNGDVGITTEVAAFLTFALGLLCFTDEGMLVAPIFAIIITTLLAVKPHLHQFAQQSRPHLRRGDGRARAHRAVAAAAHRRGVRREAGHRAVGRRAGRTGRVRGTGRGLDGRGVGPRAARTLWGHGDDHEPGRAG